MRRSCARENHNNDNRGAGREIVHHLHRVGRQRGTKCPSGELTMMYLHGHGGGGYGIHDRGGDIAGAAVGCCRRCVALRRRADAEGRHEFRSVDVEGGELTLDGLVLRRSDDIAVGVRLLFPRVRCYAVRHINQLFRHTSSRVHS